MAEDLGSRGRSWFHKIGYTARNRPGVVGLLVLALVVAHALVANLWVSQLWPGRALSAPERAGDASVLFLGAATVAAMVAGFAGVVVVFALSSGAERFRYMRSRGGDRLRANWASVVAVSFLAAGLSVAAAFMRLTDVAGWIWVFETSVLFLIHASWRLVWLLRRIAEVVAGDDADQREAQDRASVDTVVRHSVRRTA